MQHLIPRFWMLLGALLLCRLNDVGLAQNGRLVSSPQEPGQANVRIESGVSNEMESFGVGKLKQALAAAGHSVAEQGAQSVTVILREAPGSPQSYSIQRSASTIMVTGGDDRGLLYGTLRLAEEVKLGEPLEAVRDESSQPFLAVRAFKFNLPLPGTAYVSPSNLKNNQWFWNLDYWTKFLDALTEDRFNALEFWSAEPWDQMLCLAKYPEAASLSPDGMRQHIQFFRKLFQMAKARGIDTYLVTWNIDLAPAFARAHHLADQNIDNPLVRDYLRDCIRTLLITYPELTGLGTTQGEDMDVVPENKRGNWVADVYFRAIRESGRKNVPFIFRYWGGTPEDTEKAAAEYTMGPVYLDIKYNGEDVYSSPMYHVGNSAWLTQKHNYQLLWHLRNDALFSFRWGNPQFVSELMHNMKPPNPAGFTYGWEEDIPGPENFDTPAALAHRPWPYEFQKQWFMFALWGRLGYNPDLSNQLWRKYFRYEYGSAGNALYDCSVAAGRIAPLITSFHWNYMNGDWTPEGSIGSWNTSYEQPRFNYRRFEMYQGILDYVFNNTIDENYENIPQYAATVLAGAHPLREAASPLDVANDLEQDGYEALGAARIPSPGSAYDDRFQAAQSDDEAYGRLALYYAEKVRAATHLGLYMLGGRPEEQASAVTHLKNAVAEWKQLVAITQRHYLPREIWQMGVFHWSMYTTAVQHDVAIAQRTQPAATEAETWQVAAGNGSAPAWTTLILHGQRPFSAAGLYQWRLYSNALFNMPKVKQAAGLSSSYLWRRELPSSGARVWVLAIPGNPPAQVTFNGKEVTSPFAVGALSALRTGYRVYRLGSGGVVEATLPAGIVPEVTALARLGQSIVPSIATAQVVPPLAKTANGALELPLDSTSAVRVDSGVLTEVNMAGSALFRARVTEPGFYWVRCEFRGRTGGRFAVDEYNGVDNVIVPEDAAGRATETIAARKWLRASSTWAIPLGPGEHTVRVYLRHPGQRIKDVELVPAAE
ncbi:MAG: hypothetical protein ACRD3T_14930 [Terriglobia bacterium]